MPHLKVWERKIKGMTLKGTGTGPLSPLLQQYVELRDAYADYLLLFQVGDFYEVFGEDAERVSAVLGLHLTHKTSKDFSTPMAGIPLRALDSYLERLLRLGFRVAIADQVEPVAEAEGLVKREVTQLITPGTLTQEALLRPEANYLAAIAATDGYGLVLLDLSTGDFRGTVLYGRSSLYDELFHHRPTEVLLAPELAGNPAFLDDFQKRFPTMLSQGAFESAAAAQALQAHFGQTPANLAHPALQRAAGAVLRYAQSTQQGPLLHIERFVFFDSGAFMQLPESVVRTLEIYQASPVSQDQGRTLAEVLGLTRSAPGKRRLLDWLRHPLIEAGPIEARLDMVQALLHDGVLREGLRRGLHRLHDLERLSARLSLGRGNARDLVALARSLRLIPEFRQMLAGSALEPLLERVPDLLLLAERIEAALLDEPSLKLSEGNLLRVGFDPELDDLRWRAEEGRAWIAALEQSERQSTQIPTLKVGYNNVFGYYLEVTRPHYAQVPNSWRPIQTLKDRQRYTRADLQEKEREVLRAEDAARKREYAVFVALREEVAQQASVLREAAGVLAELDVYAALAEAAARYGYVRPRFGQELHLRGARHPVVERHADFIPNDLQLNRQSRLLILTGPNMAGKSTYLRQTALIALMAQIGSFVPAEEAALPIFDRIYTRIGASDDIAGGRSTFMVEMEELCRILQGATHRSLVLLDEVGRGTSTYDGLSLAWAAAEYLHHHLQSFTLFATHYFELTALPQTLPAARNAHVAAKEEAGGLVFYHQVIPGPASRSYGLEVARLAGLPSEVLQRAKVLLQSLEAHSGNAAKAVVEQLLALDPSRLSPLEALSKLHQLRQLAQGWLVEEP